MVHAMKLSPNLRKKDKKTIEDESAAGLQFLEGNPDASAEEYEAKQKEIEAKFNPIMQKIYQQSAPTGPTEDMRGDPGAAYAAPEEVLHVVCHGCDLMTVNLYSMS